MLENTDNRERESRDTGNIWYRRHKTETKKTTKTYVLEISMYKQTQHHK